MKPLNYFLARKLYYGAMILFIVYFIAQYFATQSLLTDWMMAINLIFFCTFGIVMLVLRHAFPENVLKTLHNDFFVRLNMNAQLRKRFKLISELVAFIIIIWAFVHVWSRIG